MPEFGDHPAELRLDALRLHRLGGARPAKAGAIAKRISGVQAAPAILS